VQADGDGWWNERLKSPADVIIALQRRTHLPFVNDGEIVNRPDS
jgi:hypothetical protein